MPSKVYSKEEREEMSIRLLEAGLGLYSVHGIKNVGLMDILGKVGISKPFFYTFYDSVQEFVVCLLDYQWNILHQRIVSIESQRDLSREEKFYTIFLQLIQHRETGLLIMTQAEQLWVSKRLGKANVQAFMERQLDFFRFLLQLWGVSEDVCSPSVLGNMIISIVVVQNSAEDSLPFLYLDALAPAAQMQARALARYLASFCND